VLEHEKTNHHSKKKWHDSGKDSAIPVINPDNSHGYMPAIHFGRRGRVQAQAPFKDLNVDLLINQSVICPMQPKLAFPGFRDTEI